MRTGSFSHFRSQFPPPKNSFQPHERSVKRLKKGRKKQCKMELDRAHHRPTPSTASTSSELFICFTSRLSSSSSMKMAKSILSPGRARDTPISLSTSLSRRLRTNGSIKGGQASPMFPTGGKKRGCSFENPEPSSPKVTCIGQVRVKTKKKVKQTRSLSRRRSSNSGEVSFRKVEQLSDDELKNVTGEEELSSDCASVQQKQKYAVPSENSSSHFQQQECLTHRNQKWVHLPVTICEALRTFGAEFSCLFPCRASCFSTNDRRGKEVKAGNIGHGIGGHGEEGNDSNDNGQNSSCGAVFARWFVALQDCESGKGREIELVVGGGDEEVRREARERTSMRSSRRHVFEDIEFKEEMIEVKGEEEEEKARVSTCTPPKNALLLMRCRSDPMKMAALANRFWESPAPKDEDEDENEEDEEEEENGEENKELEEVLLVQDPEILNEEEIGTEVEERDEVLEQFVSAASNEEAESQEKETGLAGEVQEFVEEEETEKEKPNSISSEELEESQGMQALVVSEEAESNIDSSEGHLDQEMVGNKEANLMIQAQVVQEVKEEQSILSCNSFSSEENSDRVDDDSEMETEKEATELLPLEAALEDKEESEAKTGNSTLEEAEAETPSQETYLEEKENANNEAKQATTLLLSKPDDTETENACEDEKLEQIEASADIQESQEPQEEDDENKGMIVETNIKDDKENSSSSNVLPDCLLLMMCEPKLSMEVSKETWVCSTDFIRWLPERRRRRPESVNKKLVNESSEDTNKKIKKVSCCTCTDTNAPPPGPQLPPQEIMAQQQQEVMLPPRSSCSLPAAAAVSMAAMIEQKLVNAVAYEPFVLTRCKSEPMRTAAAKLMPEACFWKNRKLEPHRSATYAAGVGF